MRVTLLIAFLLFTFLATAQNQSIKYFSVEAGMSQNEVTDILQDNKGFMWFATRGGLNRFDGYQFIQFKSRGSDPQGLSNPSIECIYESRDGKIWIGTKSGGIDVYDPEKGKFAHYSNSETSKLKISGNRILSIWQSSDSLFLFGSWSNGLTFWDQKTDSVWYAINNQKVSVIVEGADGTAWIGAQNGLYHYNPATKELIYESFNNAYYDVNDIVVDEDRGILWIAAWTKGLIKYDLKTKEFQSFYPFATEMSKRKFTRNSYSLLKDPDGKIYTGTWGGGLFKFDPELNEFEIVNIKQEKRGEYNNDFDIILSMFQDSSGDIWIGTDGGGACRIGDILPFKGISIDDDTEVELSNYHVWSMLKTSDDKLWIGTKGGGLYYSEDRQNFIPILDADDDVLFERFTVHCLYEDDQKQLLIGSNLGLQLLQKSNDRYELGNLDFGIEDEQIRKAKAVYKSGDIFLVGTQQSGLWDIFKNEENEAEVKNLIPANSAVLKNERITFIKSDSKSRIWVGTYDGIYFYDLDQKDFVELEIEGREQFSSQIMLCWNQFNDSIFFVGTPSGLSRLSESDNDKFKIENYYKEDGLPDDYIHALLAEDKGDLWISTNQGVSRFDLNSGIFRNYDVSDGLQGKSFSEGCAFKSRDGELFFGGANGFNYFYPDSISDNNYVPPVLITNLSINNKAVKVGEKRNGKVILENDITYTSEIKLTHKESEFALTFASLCYDAPERNNYAYRLVNHDDNWVNSGNIRTITYNNLKAGSYIFEVKGSNNHNIWNESPTSLTIKVYPAPWESWWALTIYIIIALGLVGLIRWVALRQSRLAHQLEMESLHVEQEKELSEVKLRFFTNISHEFRTPLTLILGPVKELLQKEPLSSKAKDRLHVIQENTQKLLSLVNQLLDFRKAERSEMKITVSKFDLIQYLKKTVKSFHDFAEANNIQLEFQPEISKCSLWFDYEKLDVVINNLLSNAFKYCGSPGKVEIKTKRQDNEVIIEVINNGKGIHKDDIDKIFDRFYQVENMRNRAFGGSGIGLALVKRIIELHKGQIEVTSIPLEETVFKIKLKTGNEHYSAEQIIQQTEIQEIEETVSVAAGGRPAARPPLKKGNDKFTVLIVEDKDEIRNYIIDLLSEDYSIIEASNGAEGYKSCQRNLPDLVITDVMMPVTDGVEMCRQIKQNTSTSYIPVIMLTAKDSDQFQIEGVAAGADSYITKPFNPEVLKTAMASILENRKRLHKFFSKKIRLEPSDIEIAKHDAEMLTSAVDIVEKYMILPEFGAEMMAEKMNMSTSTLYRRLKALSGMSTNIFIRSIRLKRAAQLLKDPGKSIIEISDEVGFSDLKYFRKCFKEQFGSPPSEFRQ